MENSESSCSTPASMRPFSPGMFDHLAREEEQNPNYDLSFVSSPGSQRCPTFKDYSEKIKRLQQENFQLRVRIYLNERKTGIKCSTTDLEALYAQLKTRFESGAGGGKHGNALQFDFNPQASSCASTTSLAGDKSVSQVHELEKIRTEKSQLTEKLKVFEELLANKEKAISELTSNVGELSQKNAELTSELAVSNSTIQKLSQKTDEDVEKMAYFAFGQNEEVELVNAEWEAKLKDKSNEINILEYELSGANRKVESADKKIVAMKSDIKVYEAKIHEMSEALKEMGRKCARTDRQNEKLFKKLTERYTNGVGVEDLSQNLNSLNLNQSPEKLSSIQQLIGMLQTKVKELTNFVETLLHLESKKVVTLTGLTNENRENLQKAIEQCRSLGKKLDQLFEKHDHHFQGSSSSRDHSGNSHGRHRHHSSSTESHYRMFSPVDRLQRKNSETQCNLLDTTLTQSLESANAYITRLKQDISSLELVNKQLGEEKTNLDSQVRTLESSVNVFRMANHPDNAKQQILENNKMKEENRKLLKRLTVTEDALRSLHVQHADLVAELKTLRSGYQKQTSKTSVGSTVVESTRPSDSTSPDLGIDSGHDGAINSDDSAATNYKEENRILRTTNRELALKLKQTRQALDITLEKLNTTAKEKEQVEKAICRQLHKTHTILRQAKKSVEKFTNSQCQENIKPSTSSP